jgi:hypothetical protein
MLFNQTGEHLESIYAWTQRVNEEFEIVLDYLTPRTADNATKSRFINAGSYVYADSHYGVNKLNALCADEETLKNLEAAQRLCVSNFDRIRRVGEEPGFRAMMSECTQRLPPKSYARALLNDFKEADFETLRRIGLDRVMTIDIIMRDRERVGVAIRSMRVIIDFTQRSYIDRFTFNWFKSPCVVTLIIADILVDTAFYMNTLSKG